MHAKLAEVKGEIRSVLTKLEALPRAGDLATRARREELYRELGLRQEMERSLALSYANLIRELEDVAFAAGQEAARNNGMLTYSTLEAMEAAREAIFRELTH